MIDLYGVMGEFKDAKDLLSATEAARAAGYHRIDAFCPYPDERISEAVGMRGDSVALATLLGGLFGGVFGYFMQWYAHVVDYKIIVAGRPYHSWPSFIVPIFELTILCASISGAITMFAQNRLPRLFHPVFLVDRFRERGSTDGFFLCIRSDDPEFELEEIHSLLQSLHCISMSDVPMEPEPQKESP